MKHHVRSVIGDTKLTYEEMSTILAQIEAYMNSRPISALSNDPEDLTPLTPGHFIIGESLLAVPEPNRLLTKTSIDSLRLSQRMFQEFWNRWSVEYLHTLQHRPKWAKPQPMVRVGDLVLIREANLPPRKLVEL